jgi:hypothetical protein
MERRYVLSRIWVDENNLEKWKKEVLPCYRDEFKEITGFYPDDWRLTDPEVKTYNKLMLDKLKENKEL